jgi:hypothetical protein
MRIGDAVSEGFALLLFVLATGIGATAFMDVAAVVQHWLLGTGLPDYGLVARWFGHMTHRQFRHASIAKAPAIPRERALGWLIHYATGIGYAAVLLAIAGVEWARSPSLWQPLAFSLAALVIPYGIMQPAFGLGIASSRHPHPWMARLRSLLAHLAFGVGLYLAGYLASRAIPV